MTKQEITEKIVAIISNQLKVEKGKVTPKSIFESFGTNDHDKMEILKKIEDEFNIIIRDNDFLVFGRVGSVGHLADYVEIILNKR